MKIKFLLAVFCFSICILLITGCESVNLGPGPTVLQGPKPPPKANQQEAVYQKQRLTAPDEEAPLGPTPPSAAQTVRDESLAGNPLAAGNRRDALTGVRTRPEIIFTGTITALDTASRSIALKTKDKHLSFELSNPVVRGYENVSDIKVGDTVSLGYIPNGIAIAKGENFPEDLKPQTVADDLSPKAKVKRPKQTANNRGAPVRVKYKVNRLSFADVDNNKDGKISPAELGTILPSITMVDFKRYDRNGDGSLDPSEYKAVRK